MLHPLAPSSGVSPVLEPQAFLPVESNQRSGLLSLLESGFMLRLLAGMCLGALVYAWLGGREKRFQAEARLTLDQPAQAGGSALSVPMLLSHHMSRLRDPAIMERFIAGFPAQVVEIIAQRENPALVGTAARAALATQVLKNLRIEHLAEKNALQLFFTDSDATLAANILNDFARFAVASPTDGLGQLRVQNLASIPTRTQRTGSLLALAAIVTVFGLVFSMAPMLMRALDLRRGVLSVARALGSSLHRPKESSQQLTVVESPTLQPVMQQPMHKTRSIQLIPQPLVTFPWVRAASPERALEQMMKPEPVGASSALHLLTSELERQSPRQTGTSGIVLITSSLSGERKSLLSAAIAAAFCHLGRRVFLMECHPRSGLLHECFPPYGGSTGRGAWATSLEHLRHGSSSLYLLPGLDLPAHATSDLLDGYRAWISRAQGHVDWIILDAAPVLESYADTAPLAPLATDVLLVHNRHRADANCVRAALAMLQPMMSASALRGIVHNAA
ncbi:MAG: hypothetical protein IPK32_06885 [Verrucomicrobiaceae bacterium]|nr:hypothetical protein [Verrucomicrobiaceae bacterium]